MSSAGHVFDMIIRMKNNRALNAGRRSRHARMKKAFSKHLKKREIDLYKNHLSKEEFRILKEKIKRKIRNERIRVNIIASIFTSIILGFIIFSFFNYDKIISFVKDLNIF